MPQLPDILLKVFLFYFPLLFSLCIHEFAHGWVAKKKGDLTAFHEGRLTLNPLAHIDYIGTVILPIIFLLSNSSIFFGWAKPVPVNPSAFQNPKNDLFWVAFAGPLSNFFLAFAGTACLTAFYTLQLIGFLPLSKSFVSLIEMMIYINILLGIFNLLPLHPLDGGKVLARFLPVRWNFFLENNQNYSYIALIILVFSGAFYYLALPIFSVTKNLIFFSEWTSHFFVNLFS